MLVLGYFIDIVAFYRLVKKVSLWKSNKQLNNANARRK